MKRFGMAIVLAASFIPVTDAMACSTNFCKAAVSCYQYDYPPFTAYGRCTSWNTSTCIGYQPGKPAVKPYFFYISCSTTTTRGDSDDIKSEIFNADRPFMDENGKLIETDPMTGKLVQVSTSISALKRRGVQVDQDINQAFETAGIPIVDGIDVNVSTDAESGAQTFALRGKGSEEAVVMKFNADGSPVVSESEAEVPPEILEKFEALKARGEGMKE